MNTNVPLCDGDDVIKDVMSNFEDVGRGRKG